MLLTAGNIEDMPATKDMLVELSSHPCSVIIIGIGDKFRSSSMNELDGDDGVLSSGDGGCSAPAPRPGGHPTHGTTP